MKSISVVVVEEGEVVGSPYQFIPPSVKIVSPYAKPQPTTIVTEKLYVSVLDII